MIKKRCHGQRDAVFFDQLFITKASQAGQGRHVVGSEFSKYNLFNV